MVNAYNVQVLTEFCFSPQLRPFDSKGAAVVCLKQFKASTKKIELVKFMTSRQAKLQEDTYFRVMRILHENPDLTQRELAEILGISVGGLNYCLKALMTKGWVKMRSFANSKNKFGYIYVLSLAGMSEKTATTHRFLKRKIVEFQALKAEIHALSSEVGKHGEEGIR